MTAKAQKIAASADAPFSITRRVEAPRTTVWEAFTDPSKLDQWWGPKGCPTQVTHLDFRPGGTFRYQMTFPDHQTHYGKWVYREIAVPERIVADVSFCDIDGNPIVHPYAPGWPLVMRMTSTFSERNGKTEIRTEVAVPDANSAEQKVFDENRENMRQGFGGTYDQLDAYMART